MRKISSEEVEKTLDEVRDRIAVIKPPEYTKFQNQFAHIFAGGYAAGYYSYKWAERLSANAFYDFLDNNIFDNGFSERFLTNVLSLGGSANFEEVYEKFSGKKIDNESLLKLHGII
jgi:oligopeptidase A